nr:MAG TPA: hypothetical protein [Caudoviricetes sp.]
MWLSAIRYVLIQLVPKLRHDFIPFSCRFLGHRKI